MESSILGTSYHLQKELLFYSYKNADRHDEKKLYNFTAIYSIHTSSTASKSIEVGTYQMFFVFSNLSHPFKINRKQQFDLIKYNEPSLSLFQINLNHYWPFLIKVSPAENKHKKVHRIYEM